MQLTDVTLREGAQMPGRSYSVDGRVDAGRALDRLGVSTIQAGFPVVGEDHVAVIRQLATEVDTEVSALARAIPSDVEAAVAAEADAVNVFVAVSDVQLEHVFGKSRGEVLELTETAIERARDAGAAVRLGLMDGFRTDPEHVLSVADRFPDLEIGLADTVGERTPTEVETYLDELRDGGVDLGRFGVHFHDDLGVATANTLVAAWAGVGRADVSVASLGERAGNTPIEQLVATGVLEREEDFGVDPTELVPACRDVLAALGEDVPPRRPILGEEVVTHESGLHTAVMLDEPGVFEPFDPARFGGQRRLVFGAITGAGAARRLLERANGEPTDERVEALLDLLCKRGPVGLDGALELAETVRV